MMDLYGDDRKLSELGDEFGDFLDHDVFTPPSSTASPMDEFGTIDQMGTDWLDSFFEDPILNDRMMSDALQPPKITHEHSYSLSNNTDSDSSDSGIKEEIPDKDILRAACRVGGVTDLDNDYMHMTTTSQLHTGHTTLTQVQADDIKQEEEDIDIDIDIDSTDAITCQIPQQQVVTVTRTTVPQTLLRRPTIILSTTQAPHIQQHKPERLVLPKVNIKVEAPDASPEHTVHYESIGLPPTPPSSSTSDSEGSQSPQRSAPSSPIRQTIRTTQIRQVSHTQALFSSPIPTSGVLVLTEEEKRTLVSEGYPIPNKLPLTKQEEKNLKKIRRKIKNKISAQESRRKKKEYLEVLEKRMEAYNQENSDLKKKVDTLENNNRSLLSQLQKLQAIVGKVTRPAGSQAGTCLMVLVLFFAVFLGSWSPTSISIGYMRSQQQQVVSASPLDINAINKGPMGPHIKDAIVGESYSTPNMRSRVLLSMRDEFEDVEYGPPTPFSYKDILLRLFLGSSDSAEVAPMGPIEPPLPNVQITNAADETVNNGESVNASARTPAWQATMHPDMAADLSANVLAESRQLNATA